ncbi:MAG: hypothetical protein QE271_14290 [Bacteriovoracaceae bacterium]|nr:hypothetical protein [Bacteriovoracaceae bacterium]
MNNQSNITTSKIESINPHPTSSNLKVCRVSDGQNIFSIVCGSSNIFTGMIVLLAKEGAQLPSGLNIQKTTIRGVESEGMICSPRELGIRNESGAIDLPPDTKLGLDWKSLDQATLSSTPWYRYDLVEQFFMNKDKKIYSHHHYWKNSNQDNHLANELDQLIGRTYFDSAKQVYHYQKLQG